jgi:hypothetical protein
MPSIKSIRMAELVNDATFRSDLLRLHGMAHTILFEHRGPHPTRRRSGNWLARLRRSWKRWWRTCMRPSNSFINWRNWRRKSLARAARTWRRRIFKSCISAKPRLPITRTYVNCERIAGIVVGRRPFHEYLSLVDSPDPGNDRSSGDARIESGLPVRWSSAVLCKLHCRGPQHWLEPLTRNDVPALRRARLSWVSQNFIRNETLVDANACLVAEQNKIGLVHQRGGGEVASADGLRAKSQILQLPTRCDLPQSRIESIYRIERCRHVYRIARKRCILDFWEWSLLGVEGLLAC